MPTKTLDENSHDTVSLGSYGENKDPIDAKLLSSIEEAEVGLLTGRGDDGKTLSTDSFDFVKVDPNDYEDYQDNHDATASSLDGVSDAHGIVLSGGSTMYDGIAMSGGSAMYEGLADRLVEAARGDGEVGYEVDGDMEGNDW